MTIIDDDRKLALTPSAVTVTEGGTATFAVRLASESLPGRDTIVAVSSGNTGAATVDLPSLTFTPMTWNTAQTVTVTGVHDTDTSDEEVTITLSGDGVVTGTVTVDVTDDDTAKVMGVTVEEGDAQLVVNWTAVDNATGYTVQWKSGNQDYNTESHDRQATVTPGTTTSHTITGLTNGTAYLVQVIAIRTDANDGLPSAEVTGTPAVPTGAGVITVSPTALTVTEENTTGDSYTVVLDSRPTADVTVTVAGHSGTDVTPDPGTLTFTTSNWDTVQTVMVTAGDDADTANDAVTLTHSAASTDTGYSGITIAGVVVTVRDNDTAQVTGVTVDEGDAQLVVNWTAVDNATGYTVQWTSGSEDYNTGDRQAPVTPGSTTSHTIEGLANGTEYSVQVSATRTDANDGPPSAEMTGTPRVPPPPPPPVTDLAQVLGVGVAPGNAQLVVTWTAVDTATGYTVQWTSGGQGYNTGDRQATVTPGSTTSHTIEGLANGTEYTVQVSATRTGVNDGQPSAEVTGTTPMIPVPTPTLPEIALLLLAMLLLGSGVYLLRGRQSGGLTHA